MKPTKEITLKYCKLLSVVGVIDSALSLERQLVKDVQDKRDYDITWILESLDYMHDAIRGVLLGKTS